MVEPLEHAVNNAIASSANCNENSNVIPQSNTSLARLRASFENYERVLIRRCLVFPRKRQRFESRGGRPQMGLNMRFTIARVVDSIVGGIKNPIHTLTAPFTTRNGTLPMTTTSMNQFRSQLQRLPESYGRSSTAWASADAASRVKNRLDN